VLQRSGIRDTPDAGLITEPRETAWRYDALGRLRETIEQINDNTAHARVTLTDYDPAGNVVLTTVGQKDTENLRDPYSLTVGSFPIIRRTKYAYDPLNRLERVTGAWAPSGSFYQDQVVANLGHGSPVTQYKYDAQDRIVEVIDPRNVKSVTRYDVLGRKQKEVLGWEQTAKTETLGFVPLDRRFTFDDADRLTGVETRDLWVIDSPPLDGKAAPSGPTSVWTKYEYDIHDRQTRVIAGAGTLRERHTITAYDPAGRAVAVTTGYSPTAALSAADGAKLTYSRPVTTGYTHDPLGRVKRVLVGADLSDAAVIELKFTRPDTNFEYDARGNVVIATTSIFDGTLGAPIEARESRARYEYDALGRLWHTNEGESFTGNKSQVRRTTRVYDSLDNVVGLELGDQWTRYDYDRLGRVTKQSVGVPDPRCGGGQEQQAPLHVRPLRTERVRRTDRADRPDR